MKLVFVFSLGLIPIFLWGGYFYYNNPRKQPLFEIFKIFCLGTFSILPVYFFHQWLLGAFLPDIKSTWPVFEQPFLSALLQLSFFFIFVLVFITLFGILNFLLTAIFSKKTLKQHKKLYHLAPLLVFFILFLVVEAVADFTLAQSFLLSLAGSTIFFAVLEEYFKYAINPFLVHQKINSVGTAMVHALYVGLAFAFVENILFFYASYNSPGFEQLVIFRSLATALLHVGASGVLGYFYGFSLFSNSMLATYEIERGKYKLPFWLDRLFKKNTLFQSISVTQGFFLAALFHSIFNLFLHLRYKNLAIAVVIFLSVVVVLLLRSKSSQVQYGLIGTDTMPQIDFEKLRLQISFLKEMQAIQATKA